MGMLMMNVWVMRMLVFHCRMPVPVNMVVTEHFVIRMLMLVMHVMRVIMRMLKNIVCMLKVISNAVLPISIQRTIITLSSSVSVEPTSTNSPLTGRCLDTA